MKKKILQILKISLMILLPSSTILMLIPTMYTNKFVEARKPINETINVNNLIDGDIKKFWNEENYSKKVSYKVDWKNDIRAQDNSWFGGYTQDFTIEASDKKDFANGLTIQKENGNLNFSFENVINNEFTLDYNPNLGETGGIVNQNPNWKVPKNWDWERKYFLPKLISKKITSNIFETRKKNEEKSTNISNIYKLSINNQSEGITIPSSKANWKWASQTNPGNTDAGFKKTLFEYGESKFSFFGREIINFDNEFIFLNKDMESRIINTFLKFNPEIKLNQNDLLNDPILNFDTFTNNKMPKLFLFDENLILLKELFDIYKISNSYNEWILEKDKDNWSGVHNISEAEAKRVYADILKFNFSNLKNVTEVVNSIMNNQKPKSLIPGILNSSVSNKLFNKLQTNKLIDLSFSSFSKISLEKYAYIYKTIIGFFSTKDIKLNLNRTMLNTNQEIKDIFIWKDGKFINDKNIWHSLLEKPSDVEVSSIKFKINNLSTLNREQKNVGFGSNLISENVNHDVDFNFWIKYRIDGENWIGGLENTKDSFEININENVENIIGSKYSYQDENGKIFNIGLNNYWLGDIFETNILKQEIVNELNKVLKTKNSTNGLIQMATNKNNLFGFGIKARDEAIKFVGIEKWKNAWSKFNIPLVLENDKLNPSNIPVILANNFNNIFYSYIKINNWILEDGTSNWTSENEKNDFIKSLNLGGLKIVEIPLTSEERKKDNKWDKNGHFIIKIKII